MTAVGSRDSSFRASARWGWALRFRGLALGRSRDRRLLHVPRVHQ